MKGQSKIKWYMVAVLLLAGGLSADLITTNKLVKATDDAMVIGGLTATNNYGAIGTMRLTYANGTWGYAYSLTKFDLSAIPTNAVVTNVRMAFYASAGSFSTPTNFAPVSLYENTAGWSESTVTFNTAPAHGGSALQTLNYFHLPTSPVYFTGANTIATNYVNWLFFTDANVKNLVQGWVSGATANNGVTIAATGSYLSDSRRFDLQSSEGGVSVQPYLLVNYTIIPEPGTLGLLMISSVGILMARRLLAN